jgi:transposase-like protein
MTTRQIAKRNRKPPTCPSCHKGGYAQSKAEYDGRPEFKCGHCGHSWTNGKDGGEYAK